MSVVVNIKELSTEQLKTIRNVLFIQKKMKWIPCSDGNLSRIINSNREKEYIQMFLIDNVNNILKIPYAFACKLFKKRMNLNKNFTKLDIKENIFLRECQKNIVEECLNDLKEIGTIIIDAETGTGKTMTSVYLTTKLKVRTLIIHNKNILTDQWVKTYRNNTDAKIMFLNSSKIYFTYDYIIDGKIIFPDVIITIYSQLKYIPEQFFDDIGLLIIDELHLMCTKDKVESLLKIQPIYIIACSATPDRDDNQTDMIISIAGTRRHRMIREKSVRIIKIETGIKPSIIPNKLGTPDWSALVKSLYENKRRQQIIIDLIKNNYEKNKIIVGVSIKKYAKELCDEIKKLDMNVDYLAGNKSKYEDKEKLVLVGIPSKMGVGFDEESATDNFSGVRSNMLIMTFSIKKREPLLQFLGRIREKNSIIFDVVDDNGILKKHFDERCKVYKEMDADIEVVDMRNNENVKNKKNFMDEYAKNIFDSLKL